MKIQLDACFGLLIDAGFIGALRRKTCDEGGVRKSGHRHKQRHFLDDKVRNHKKLYRKKNKKINKSLTGSLQKHLDWNLLQQAAAHATFLMSAYESIINQFKYDVHDVKTKDQLM